MQSEYPDTTWAGLPRWYSEGRDGKKPTLSVIHYTAGPESRTSAEGGAAYDKTRPQQVSCHCFHDPDSSVQELPRAFRAYSAFAKGNRLGIQHELCGTAQTRAQWLDEASDAILWRVARAVAQDCKDFGLEPRRLSVAEVRASWYSYPNGPRGICGHVDITRAFPEDGGDHTDPGDGFPWDVLIARVKHYLSPIAPLAEQDDDGMIMYHAIDDKGTPVTSDDVPVFCLVGGFGVRVTPDVPVQSLQNKLARSTGDSTGLTKVEWNALMALFRVDGYRFNKDGTFTAVA